MSTCPSCGGDANVQKVSGLYREQSATRGSTGLAQLLAPPRIIPTLPDDDSFTFSGCIAGCIAFLLTLICSVALSLSLFGHPDSANVGLFVGIFVGGFTGSGAMFAYNNWRASLARSMALVVAETERQSPEHLRRLDQWEQAYYCHKHDIVILSEESKTFSPTEFRRLMKGDI